MPKRFLTILGAAALALVSDAATSARVTVPDPPYWPTAGWRTSTPEAQGFDSEKLTDVLTAIRERGIPIHSLQVVRNGYLILDAFFYPYDSRALHDAASVTKSVTATLVGMVSAQGLLPSLNAPLLSLFPERVVANRDQRKDAVTIEDLLTMRPGFDCEERGGEPTLREMRQHPDWVQFTLDRPMVSAPGQTFAYCSPGMHVLSAALTQITHRPALEFARRMLFAPLGIDDAVWPADSQGHSFGWGDLHLHPLDMAKLGFLYLHEGRWAGRQILPANWVEAATSVHASPRFRNAYGYGWWVFTGAREGQYEAVGRGGQRISVIPDENLVVVLTGGGFEPGDVGTLLSKALGPNRPLPENAAATSRLASAVRAAAAPPAPHSARSLPAMAVRISGTRYQFPLNDLGLRSAELRFASASAATFAATFADGRTRRYGIGLDGVPRVSKRGRFDIPVALSGEWASADTFRLNYDEAGNINMFAMRWTFADPQHVKIDVTERSDGSKFTLAGAP